MSQCSRQAAANCRLAACAPQIRVAPSLLFLNPKPASAASQSQRTLMKTTILTCLGSIALALTAFGQTPTPAPSPSVSATAVASASAGASISPAASATPEDEDS